MANSEPDASRNEQSPTKAWMTPLRLNLLIIALLIAALNGGIIYLCYVAITGDEVSHFVIGALIGLLPTGITGLVGIGTTLTKPSGNRVAAALRLAANALHRSDSALGAFLRRKKAHLGAPKAITATAHKLARIIYSMLRYGHQYVDASAEYYERQYQQRALRAAKRSAIQLGYQLVSMYDAQPSGLPQGPEAAAP